MVDLETGQRFGALDQALLFISALSGGISAAVFLPNPSSTGTATLTVFLLVTTLLPLYVGYMRGAVELDSVFERTRGWVYLIFGGGIVFLTVGLRSLNPTYPYQTLEDAAVGFALAISYFFAFLLLLLFTLRFVDWAYEKVAGFSPSGAELSGLAGATGALFLGNTGLIILASLGAGFNTGPITDPLYGRIATLLGAPVFVLPLFYVEFNCHRESSLRLADEGFQERIRKLSTDIHGWRIDIIFFLVRMLGWTNVEARDVSFVLRIAGCGVLLVVGDNAIPYEPSVGFLMMSIADLLSYYFLWRYMRAVWVAEFPGRR